MSANGFSRASNQYVNNPFLQKDKVFRRQYQLAIFATAARSNCLVVVPTGLGKTAIAILLCIQRLTEIPGSKVIFLAPTRPLVDQHLRTFSELTKFTEDQLVVLTGQKGPEKRIAIYQSSMIFFMTPQVLQNDLIGNRLHLKDVSLMIFDEAHRATGDYAYSFLAKKYVQQNPAGKILAMTASPGKNREKIEEVIANLHLNAVEIRTEEDPDVKPYIQDVEIIWKDVELPPELLKLHKSFDELSKQLIKELVEQDLVEATDSSNISRKQLLDATTALDLQINQAAGSPDLSRLLYLKKRLSNAIRLSHMQELLETQGLLSLKAFLDKSQKEVEDGTGGKSLRELINAPEVQSIIQTVNSLIKQNVDHPKMAVLMSLLVDEFKASPKSRVLLFCQYRDTVNTVVDTLNQSPLIHAERFVGQQKRGKEKGLSQKNQLEILQKFKAGEFNTLVATSVAEEGLDISECDIVVFYEIVASEIRAIQRRGRTGRNRSGKVYILKTKGTREEGYFWAERSREREMRRNLQELRAELQPKFNAYAALQRAATDPNQTKLNAFMKSGSYPAPITASSSTKSTLSISPSSEIPDLHEIPAEEITEQSDDVPPTISPSSEGGVSNMSTNPIDQIIAAGGLYVLTDTRETASPVARELSNLNAAIELKTLPIGDYIVSDRVGIERKAIPDFVASLKDGRLFDELFRLRSQFLIPILILEGDLIQAATIQRPALLGAISTIMVKLNIFIYQTKTPLETAEVILALAKKEQGTKPSRVNIRFKKVPNRIQQKLEYIVAGIPGINTTRAQELLQEFDTVKALFNASPAELQKVPNIGPKTAETIHLYANASYNEKRDEENGDNDAQPKEK